MPPLDVLLLIIGCVLLYGVIGAILNRWRGGGKYPILRHIPFARYWVSGYYTIPIIVAIGVTDPWVILIGVIWFGLCYDSVRRGWGSYFDLGTWSLDWKDSPEVRWIDWVLFRLFGAKWIPDDWNQVVSDKAHAELIQRRDIVDGPYGQARPYSWRFWRDFTGMTLRGLHYSVPQAIMVGVLTALGWSGVSYLQAGLLAPIGLGMGVMYYLGWRYLPQHGFGEITWGTMYATLLMGIVASPSLIVHMS